MRYISTNGVSAPVSTREAVARCLAADGGLFMPESLPELPKAFFNNIGEMNLKEIAYVVASAFLADELDAADIKHIVDYSFDVDVPLVSLSPDVYVLELFHGATLTFKDYGARFMARLLKRFDAQAGVGRRTVVVATTGNSGAATANGLFGIDGVNVLVLYPKGALSRMQMLQFVTLGGNVYPVEVDGSIEDCKSLAKAAMNDPSMSDMALTCSNSINIGRLIPQVAFAFQAYARLSVSGVHNADGAVFAVPCGNLSNLVAVLMARGMGLPMSGIVAACNTNDSLGRCMRGEELLSRPVPTLAPSMDISRPSGLPRLLYLCGQDLRGGGSMLEVAPPAGDREIAATVLRLRAESGYTMDPHSAAAYASVHGRYSGRPKVVFATGHPAKNIDIMTRITGGTVELPVQLMRFMEGKRRFHRIPATLPALRRYLSSLP